MPIDQVLSVCVESADGRQGQSLRRMLEQIRQGCLLSHVLARELRISPTLAGLIEHGEASGDLARTVCRAHDLLEREDLLARKCLSALAYPCIIGIFALGLTFGLVRGVLPQIIPMLYGLHVHLPILTQIVIAVSNGLLAYGAYLAMIMAAAAVIAVLVYGRSVKARRGVQSICGRIPIAGGLLRDYSCAIFLRSCGTLVESGVDISQAYRDCARTISFWPMQEEFDAHSASIAAGISVGAVLGRCRVPRYVGPLVSAGQLSGTLGVSMNRAAAVIDRDIEHALKQFTTLIEPLMMIFMGVIVGSVALSIMMPIYDISRVLQH
ncbi:MAG: type II secretion system F family protein [Patescibacteria group bacterium]|nr:type II secretion system F family protein [Patescibacteria group bacterium]MDE2172556.1 type II secretion system F family protein [Patescibacteria group bacterium]